MAADGLGSAGSDPLTRLTSLGERGKEPASKSILNAWVNQAQAQVGLDTGRLGWLIASTVVVAALLRGIDDVAYQLSQSVAISCQSSAS
jgi:hypothetical protein